MLLDRTLYYLSLSIWVLLAFLILTSFIRILAREGFVPAIRKTFSMRVLYVIFLVALGISLLSASMVFVEPQEVGVVVSLADPEGYRDRPFRSGLKWIIPFIEEVHRYPIYWQTYTMSQSPLEGAEIGDDSITARTYDGQEVAMDCSVIFQIDPEQVIRVHIEWQSRYIEDFVRPVLRGIIRTQVSQYTVDEVNSYKRLDLERDLEGQVREVLEEKGFILDRFILRNIAFTPQYADSVEQKQVALQEATMKEYEAEQIRRLAGGEADRITIIASAEAEAIRVKAEAEADALRVIADALQNNASLLTYRYIEKLAPGIQVMLVPNDQPYILPLPDIWSYESGMTDLAPTTPATSATEASTPTPTPEITPTPGSGTNP